MPDIENIAEHEARMQRWCEHVNDRIDIAACAYQWAMGKPAHPWYRGLSRQERKTIWLRMEHLGRVSNGHGLADVQNAGDEAALAVLGALPLTTRIS